MSSGACPSPSPPVRTDSSVLYGFEKPCRRSHLPLFEGFTVKKLDYSAPQ